MSVPTIPRDDIDTKIDWVVSESAKYIGKEAPLSPSDAFLAGQAVEKSEIRRYALCNRDPNPLYLDEAYAKHSRWGGIIAPASFLLTCYSDSIKAASPVELPGIAEPGHQLHAGIEVEFPAPIRPGDVLRPSVHFGGVNVIEGGFAGRMILTWSVTTTRNQHGDLVGIHRNNLIRFPIARAQQRARYELPEDYGLPTGMPSRTSMPFTGRGATPRFFEDVKIGDVIPPQQRELTIPDIVAQESVSVRDGFGPPQDTGGLGCYWHYLPQAAREVRAMPTAFDVGRLRYSWVGQLLMDWAGDDAWLRAMRMQTRKPIFAGDVTQCQARVTNKHIDHDEHLIDVDVWFENNRREISTRGTCTVQLPSRRHE